MCAPQLTKDSYLLIYGRHEWLLLLTGLGKSDRPG